jgi:hypothetical protein
MHDEYHSLNPVLGWQQRRSRVQAYFCCCPFILPRTPVFLVARLVQYGALRLLGQPVAAPWAHRPTEAA